MLKIKHHITIEYHQRYNAGLVRVGEHYRKWNLPTQGCSSLYSWKDCDLSSIVSTNIYFTPHEMDQYPTQQEEANQAGRGETKKRLDGRRCAEGTWTARILRFDRQTVRISGVLICIRGVFNSSEYAETYSSFTLHSYRDRGQGLSYVLFCIFTRISGIIDNHSPEVF